MARAIWKGEVTFDGVRLPVKLYSGVEDRTIRFHLLDKHTLTRVKQRLVDSETGEEVPSDQVRKGYEVESGTFVLLDDEELNRLEPEASRAIEIEQFLKAGTIKHQWYDRPYYLGPDGGAAEYFALAEAMERRRSEAVARWVMRKREYLGALRSENGYLMLMTLRRAEEVLSARELPAPAGRPPDAKERAIASQLVAALEDEFRPEDYRDEYRERVMKLIEAKAHGEKPRLKVVRARPKAGSLRAMLEASLKAAKSRQEVAAA
ncbi:MAG: Ku protein [Bryobacteraceae bacterium]|nr:Ku protein [Bryobacteraceae bacterium]